VQRDSELGKTSALKTIFLSEYLRLEPLRREIHEGLNVIENWNSANSSILYGKGGEFASNKLEDQEILMLSLHLLQVSLVYINTLMIQQVLEEEQWKGRLNDIDLRALSPSRGTPHETWIDPQSNRRPSSTIVFSVTFLRKSYEHRALRSLFLPSKGNSSRS
jgi:hypothetical protein